MLFYTIKWYFFDIPKRLGRLLRHMLFPFLFSTKYVNRVRPRNVLDWFIEMILYLFDCLAIPELYEVLQCVFKWKTRGLTEDEKTIGLMVFGDSIRYDLVKMDNQAVIGPKQGKYAYVSFNTINYYGSISDHLYVHELIHIWQFQHFGSVYAYRSLGAQFSKEKYDYGGVERLYAVMTKGGNLLEFNFEQQGDIVQDYFSRIKRGKNHNDMTSKVYQYFIGQLHRRELNA